MTCRGDLGLNAARCGHITASRMSARPASAAGRDESASKRLFDDIRNLVIGTG